ncbi:MAG: hypothetical protein ACLQGP_20695 [Isosphaeraceae bacterium]
MFKKLLTAGMTLALLWGCYVAYGYGFDLVVQHFRAYRTKEKLIFERRVSRSKQRAIALARQTLGDDHWSVTNDQPYAYYSSERGFWMYALEVEEVQEENGVRYDGKRLKLKPFAMIIESADGKTHQTLTADRATLDMNQPVGLSSSRQGTEPMKILHALIEGDVRIRDDRGTPMNPSDDMNIREITHLIFDDGNQQITTDSHVVMQDPEQTTTGDGMLIQMRRKDPKVPAGQSSSGFQGAEYLVLQKNPRVVLRDVGDSGVLPGAAPAKKSSKGEVVKVQAGGGGSAGKKGQVDAPKEASPLVILSEGPMRVDFAEELIPVLAGPPEPPAPTKVKFERNVVALQTHAGRQPDQLNCDTLKLTLIPSEKAPEPKSANAEPANVPPQGGGVATAQGGVATVPGDAVARSDSMGQEVRPDAKAGSDAEIIGAIAGVLSQVDPGAWSSPRASSGPFGNLTLQKANATGHAVWLQLREQGAKVLCNELIHERRAPYLPDRTYFRGDATRKIWLEKVDREPIPAGNKTAANDDASRSANGPRQGKITGVTHVMTQDATLYDMGGGGLDVSDIVARGPGKLEARPDLTEPVERIAVWQDELTIQNILGPESQLLQKKITLTGSRPYFVDTVEKTSIDSGELIHVWLKPKTAARTGTPGAEAGRSPATPAAAPASDAFAVASNTEGGAQPGGHGTTGAEMGMGGGGLQIERLQAFRDAHFRAPGKRMEARDVLDTSFVEAEPTPLVAATTPAVTDGPAGPAGTAEAQGAEAVAANEPAKAEGQAPATVAAKDAEPKPAPEPTMTGVADRIWAKVALEPGSGLDAGSSRRRSRTAARPTGEPGNAAAIVAAESADAKQASGSGDSDTDIREAWMWGNVVLHQESPPDKPENPDGSKAKPKMQDIHGEAVYMDNYRGKGKMLARVYHQDPNGPPLPGPRPLAKVAMDDKTIRSTLIRMDQEHDKVWCDGPGELTQLTERSLFTDKKEEPKAEAEGGASDAGPDAPDAVAGAPGSPGGGGNRIRTSAVSSTGREASRGSSTTSKPRTRGGRPISDKDLLTITWATRMEFTGRATDPSTKLPAGRADFYGFPNAMMEDAQLKCDERMIVFTDREMPLGELGSISKGPNKSDDDAAAKDGEAKDESTVDLSLIYCFGRSLAVTRKMDPDVPVWLEQHMILAKDRLDYNRRTGEFIVPGAGQFYKYERTNDSEKVPGSDGKNGERNKNTEVVAGRPDAGRTTTASRRTVTPTSSRTASGASSSSRTTASAGGRSARSTGDGNATSSPAATPPVSRTFPPLVLTQIFFTKGLQGQFGTSQDSSSTQDRSAILFGDIQLRHAKVNSVGEAFDFDQPLTEDGFFLTSQILRLIQEPPPPGSPPETPARSFLKAWDNVIVNKGQSMVIYSDVGTYDSGTDQLYAYGEGDRGVTMMQQHAVGQSPSPAYGKALQFNIKSGAAHFVDSDLVQLFDKRTGARPGVVGPPDPNVKKPRRRNAPFMVPNNNLERRGFTGQ